MDNGEEGDYDGDKGDNGDEDDNAEDGGDVRELPDIPEDIPMDMEAVPGPSHGGGGDRADNLDSIMGFMLTQAADSLDSLNRAQGRTGRPPGDWTKTDKNGQKWGWDQQGIRLGKVMIPNALLALLPLNAATAGRMSGNMSQMDADRRLAASRADIMRMSERGLGEADFRKIANELRDRRESERRNRLKAPSATVAAPLKSGGENK